ncbi:PAS domain S-box protein [Trichocoleus sp. FACHB-591]|uniref:PAS domain S-box protein n=1 Tax=Trichocoleus sp. FACHB-591 TaxID=2692872 RepID=UPI0016896AB7|nr:PAS domain S-box protein [Trichocoleus sp. FACHB-591]MBD2097778.1 PAS domain S-box protein [Trichocoleus sp. FACHB-591]
MWEFFGNFLYSDQFIPHGHCYLWQPHLVWLHVISDLAIALAYYSIPVLLLYFIHKRRDIPFPWIFLLFCAFIIACGTTHILEVWTLWYPIYWVSGTIKAFTAIVSLFTALELGPLMPKLLALPSSAQLEKTNRELEQQILERQQAELALQSTHSQLEIRVTERTAALAQVNKELRLEIAERQHMEATLRESEQRFRATFEQAAVGIGHVGLDGQWLRVNQKLCDIVGYSRSELLNLTFQDITHPDDLAADLGHVHQILAGTISTFSMEKRYICKDGSTNWVNLTVSLMREATQPKYFISVIEDISERRQAEAKLQKSLKELSDIKFALDQAAIVAATDQKGTINYVNDTFCELSQYSREELIGKNHRLINSSYHDLDFFQNFWATISKGKVWKGEIKNRAKDGSYYWVDTTIVPFLNEQSQPFQYLSIRFDITNRKQIEEDMRTSLREKEVLLKEIHHRVKNNLQIISSLLNLQAQYLNDSAALAIFRESQNRIESMALIHEKLYQSKDMARINASEYIYDLVTNLFYTYEINSEAIALKINIDEIWLGLDTAIPCGLIINELVLNALKHAFPKGHTGEICISFGLRDAHHLMLVVSDTGVGLPRDLDYQNTDSLGLQLVNALTQQLEGVIEINQSNGVKFEIVFSN